MALSYTSIKSKLDKLAARKAPAAAVCAEALAPVGGAVVSRLLERHCGAEALVGARGRVLRWTHRLPGAAAVLAGRAVAPEQLAVFNLPPGTGQRVCFLDTETTGLMGHSGTIAFLVGIGWWAEGGFCLEQYLVEDYCHEEELLTRLAGRLAEFDVVCTYNGKSYDMPLLRARAIMNRRSPQAFALPQIDLLHPARGLWREALGNVRLKTVELQVLGIDRGEDIPGAEIPAVFQQLAGEGDADRIDEVLRHNAQDIATLAVLLGHVANVIGDPVGCGLLRSAGEYMGVARHFARRGCHAQAAGAWRCAAELAPSPADAAAMRLAEARSWRRAGCAAEAVEAWVAVAGSAPRPAIEALIELAKYAEHTARDPAGAMEHVRRAITMVAMQRDLAAAIGGMTGPHTACWDELMAALHRRETRLRRRLAATP